MQLFLLFIFIYFHTETALNISIKYQLCIISFGQNKKPWRTRAFRDYLIL